jgi:hypothetical protein
MRRPKSSNKSVRKCQKGVGPAGSRIRRCGKRTAARVYSPERERWVPICREHAREFRRTFPGEIESLKSIKA